MSLIIGYIRLNISFSQILEKKGEQANWSKECGVV